MCGLVGLAGDLAYKDEAFIKRLLILDYFRGTDSTGLAVIDKSKKACIAKAAVNPIDLFDTKQFDRALSGYTHTAYIGHNRAATLGGVNNNNAHPFQYGDIVGAHNGTLDKASWERLEFESGVETDVDSAAIFACINEVGIHDTIKLMEKGRTSSTGAWALVWWDKKDDTINFLRNAHRPLWFGFNRETDIVVWASEWEMMNAAQQLTSGWGDYYSDDGGFSFFPFEEDHHYSFKIPDLVAGLYDDDIEAFKGAKIEGRPPAPVGNVVSTSAKSGGAGPWKKNEEAIKNLQVQSGGKTSSTGSTLEVVTKPSTWEEELDDDTNVLDFIGRSGFPQVETSEQEEDNPLGGYISEAQFNQMAEHGCGWCGDPVHITDKGMTIYVNDDIILCSNCTQREDENLKFYLPPTGGEVIH